jgi:hypothetical protein
MMTLVVAVCMMRKHNKNEVMMGRDENNLREAMLAWTCEYVHMGAR